MVFKEPGCIARLIQAIANVRRVRAIDCRLIRLHIERPTAERRIEEKSALGSFIVYCVASPTPPPSTMTIVAQQPGMITLNKREWTLRTHSLPYEKMKPTLISRKNRTAATSVYPLRPPGSEVVVRFSENDLTSYDKLIVYLSSLFFVGGVFWVPALYAWAWKKFRSIPKTERKRRAVYLGLVIAASFFFAIGPHRNRRVGALLNVHKWSLWKSWLRFFAFEIVADLGLDSVKHLIEEQAIVAVSPHGIFPFGLAFAALSESSAKAFGRFRAVVASATQMIPWVRDVLKWVDAVDASRSAVNKAISEGSRIGLAPGGIAEMFEGYPKSGAHPDEEYAIVRKGIFRLAVQHGVPIVPVYCFGSTKLLRRLQLPSLVERISLLFRVSLVVFYGQFFLPIPFRQKLLYVMGRPIYPTAGGQHSGPPSASNHPGTTDEQVDEMFAMYCDEMVRIFERQKESYGWAHKTLKLITR